MTLASIAVVGRPNVGKSTLFNFLTASRDALVVDAPGITRDRQYGLGKRGPRPYMLIDTSGIESLFQKGDAMQMKMLGQAMLAIEEADCVFFMVDAKCGLHPQDQALAQFLKEKNKRVLVLVNKMDAVAHDSAYMHEFFALGFEEVLPISAAHARGMVDAVEKALAPLPLEEASEDEEQGPQAIRVSIVGRPNVGKSTLINRLLGEERVIAYDQPGTTRDSIEIPYAYHDQPIVLIDTAGMRRRSRVHEVIERFSIIKTMQAIEKSHVVIFVMDAREGITDQDLSLLSGVIEQGRSLVLAFNKWDGLEDEQKETIHAQLKYRLHFVQFAEIFKISALHGTNVGLLMAAVIDAYTQSMQTLSSSKLTRVLQEAVAHHAPPLVQGRRIKLRYAHCGGHNPPIVVIHGNQTDDVPETYERYLQKRFMDALSLSGTPLQLVFKSSENPFAGRRNTLTPRQQRKRERMLKHVKRRKD